LYLNSLVGCFFRTDDVGGGVAPHLLRRRRDAGNAGHRREVADDEDLRVAGDGEVGLDLHPAAAIERRVERPAERRAGDARGPDDGFRFQALGAERHAAGVDAGDALAEPDRDAEPLELQACFLRQRRRVGRQHAVGAFDQHHPRSRRVHAPEFALERVARDLRERARELDAGRAAADDDEGEPGRALRRVGLALGALESGEHARADVERFVEGLQARREGRPGVVAEIVVDRAAGDDEVVVGNGAAGLPGKPSSDREGFP
jgi:hypothetical protein